MTLRLSIWHPPTRVFANGGLRLSPVFVNSVRNCKGDIVLDFGTNRTQVLDPRVAFVMTNMLEGVINFGTAYGVRSRGFTAPGGRQNRHFA